MEKLLNGIFLSLCLSTVAHAQDVVINSSAEFTNQLKQGYWDEALGQDETGYYVIRRSDAIVTKDILLEKFSLDLKPLFAINIESSSGTMNNLKLHRSEEMSAGRIFVFLEGWMKELRQNSFLVREILKDGTVDKKEYLLETDSAESLSKASSYKAKFSPDGSKLLVLTEKPYVKDAKETLRLKVFDTRDFSTLWFQDITLDNTVEKGRLNDIIVDNVGTAYLFKTLSPTSKSYTYQLLSANKTDYNMQVLDLQGFAPSQRKMMINHSGQLQIGAMLSSYDRNATDWQATWFFQADTLGKIVQNKIVRLGEELIWNFQDRNSEKKVKTKLDHFKLKDILLKPDNGILLLAENETYRESHVNNAGQLTYAYDMLNEHALIMSFDGSGDREWNTILDKKQQDETTDTRQSFNSYTYQLLGDQLYLIWNYTDIRYDIKKYRFRHWIDDNGNRVAVDDIFGPEALFPTFMTVIDKDGNFVYDKRTFKSLPLAEIQKPNSFQMAVNPTIFFPTPTGIVLLSHMRGMNALRYKLSKVTYP